MRIGPMLAIFSVIASAAAHQAGAADTKPAKKKDEFQVRAVNRKGEARDRAVDRAALEAQLLSIKKLKTLLAKASSHQMRGLLTLRLGESYQQCAALAFRIGKGQTLGEHSKYHSEAIKYFSQLIQGYPNFPEIDSAYAFRGKSYEEMKNIPAAKKDYLKLVNDFPDHPSTSQAYFSLAGFEIEKNNHVEAIRYLEQLEKRPFDPFHPFALFKLAWSHYNLKHLDTALDYLVKHTAYYRDPSRGADDSSKAILESGLLDYALFSYDAWENEPEKNNLPYLKDKFLEIGKDTSGRMAVRFTKLLRSRSQNQAMREWKKIVLATNFSTEDQISMLGIIFEHQVNNNRFPEIQESCQDLTTVYSKLEKEPPPEVQASTEKLVLTAIDFYTKQAIKNKKSAQVHKISELLISLYDTFIKIIPAEDPRTFQSRFNLAEILFEVQDYRRASEQYRYIIDKSRKTDVIKNFTFADISLRAISSDFEALKKTSIFPKELKARKSVDKRSLPADFSAWLAYIDKHVRNYKYHSEDFNQFAFDANRVLYDYGQLDMALPRLEDFATRNPNSKYAVPAASLTLDTLVLQENWDRVYEITRRWIENDTWKDNEFMAKVVQISESAFLKRTTRLMSEKKWDDALDQADFFLKKFKKSQYRADAWLIKSRCHLELKEDEDALEALSALIKDHPKFDKIASAHLMRAGLLEKTYQFSEASQDAIQALLLADPTTSVDKKDEEALRFEKALFFAWIDRGLPRTLDDGRKNKLCDRFAKLCRKYGLIVEIESKKNPSAEFSPAADDSAEIQYLSAIRELIYSKEMSLEQLSAQFKNLTRGYKKVDRILQLSFLPELTLALKRSFTLFETWVAKKYFIYDDTGRFILSIKKRVKREQEFEDAIAPVLEIPWMHLRVLVLHELSESYRKLSIMLRETPLPKRLSVADEEEFQAAVDAVSSALDEKRLGIQEQAFQIASNQSVEHDLFKEVSEAFFRDHPKQGATIRFALQDVKAPLPLSVDRVLPDFDWKQSELIKLWKKTFDQGNVPKMVYLLEGQKQPMLWALLSVKIGAKSEALHEMENGLGSMEPKYKSRLQIALLSHYLSTYALEHAKKHFKALRTDENARLSDSEEEILKKSSFSLESAGVK